MNTIYRLDIKSYTGSLSTYIVLLLLLCLGFFAGNTFSMHTGEGIFLNSPYTIGFMIGMLSLAIIFIATVIGSQLLFKEWDSRFDILLFSTPLVKQQFVTGRFLAFFLTSFISFLFITGGFALGQLMRNGADMQNGFHLLYFVYPLLVFGFVNCLLVCSLLSFAAWTTRNKLLVAVSGLLLYILYMVVLLFSNSPFMAQSMPQSQDTQFVAALIDPFGLSGFFYESRNYSVTQRNNTITPLTGSFLINRLSVTIFSILLLLIAMRVYRFGVPKNRSKKKKNYPIVSDNSYPNKTLRYQPAAAAFSLHEKWKAIYSFFKTDLLYIFKGRALPITTLALLFYLGMEMYAEIEKGIRIPEKFASSGLLASSILENFHTLGMLLVLYYCNDILWRSKISRFYLLEEPTAFNKVKMAGHWFSISVLILFFSGMAISLGIAFQYLYQYTHINVAAYSGILLFNSLPLILLAGFLLLVNQVVPHKYFGLGLSLVIVVLFASPLSSKFIHFPLFRFLTGFKGEYSDFNGYGSYALSFAQRLLFGGGIFFACWWLFNFIKTRTIKWSVALGVCFVFITGMYSGTLFMEGYIQNDKITLHDAADNYEKQFRKYQQLPQPVITDVSTKIHLYPSSNRYQIEGKYILKNKTNAAIDRILIQFDEALELKKAILLAGNEKITLSNKLCEIQLQEALAASDSAVLHFTLDYNWLPVNGHQSFNAIINNGSFMRISRHYPKIGYQSDREITDEQERVRRGLGKATVEKKLGDPRTSANDFIHLTMQVDTDADQTVAGTGDLVKQWKIQGRNYFRFQTPSPVPFRFAVSSARYASSTVMHDSVLIRVLYHPQHAENVTHLIKNIGLTLDYCRTHFGPYPFNSISFAEVSLFTRGFAGTAYPSTIFMTENMIFHANIKADQQQDVINELAAHELSHLWWGGNQLAPDEREGAAMLTETLAMYTEMMLYKKMYGKEKMMQRLQIHQQIYDAERGFSPNQPLYKVSANNNHISYSKGSVAMVQLSELIGETTVNRALRQLLIRVRESGHKPISTDLIEELMAVSAPQYHPQIRKLLMEI